MPTSTYLHLEGTKTGKITEQASTLESVGNSFQESHKNEIMVQAFSHQVHRPHESQFGESTGQRVHKPLMISKVVDKSSPLIYRALAIKDKMLSFVLSWYRIGENGPEIYYKIELTDAVVVDIQTKMPFSNDPNGSQTILEDVYFTYREIIWSHEGGRTTASDDLRNLNDA